MLASRVLRGHEKEGWLARLVQRGFDALDQPAQQEPQLVAGPLRLGRHAPVLAQLAAVEEPDDGLRVPDVDREQHQSGTTSASVFRISTVTSWLVSISTRGMIRVGRFLSHTHTSSICRWKNG